VRGVLLPGAPDGVPHVSGVLRTPSAKHLEVEVLLESLEQPLPATQHERWGGDRELVDHARRKALADQVGTTTEGDPAVAGELACQQQRGVEAVNEQEARTPKPSQTATRDQRREVHGHGSPLSQEPPTRVVLGLGETGPGSGLSEEPV